MKLTNLLEKRSAIYGVCALWIILFHVFRRISMPYIPVLTDILAAGTPTVDVFFFLSGVSLTLAAEKHHYMEKHWKGYLKRRLERILIPYFIVGIPYYLWNCIYEVHGSVAKKILAFFANLSSASWWLRGTQTTWYVYAIILFYCLFPFLFCFIKKRSRAAQITLFVGMIGFAIMTAYIPILNYTVKVWSGLPIFTLGIWAGNEFREKQYNLPMTSRIACLAIILLIGAVISNSELSPTFTLPIIYRNLLHLPLTLALMALLSVHQMKTKLRVLEWLGGLSLELYLVHVTLLHPIKYYGIMDAVGYWLYLILPLVSGLLAWIVKKLEEIILNQVQKT